jgi:hypothetical protein
MVYVGRLSRGNQPSEEGREVHAVLVTFTSSAGLSELEGPFTEYAHALKGVTGLVAKTWIRDRSRLGGFHVFTSREAADNYLSSDMVAGLTSNPAFSDFQIAHFDILDELSAITHSPQAVRA